jgi:hypothetical protein
MKMKHTPGPWTHDETWDLIMAAKGVEVAACHAGRGADSKANARLIAACPDMLIALQTIRAVVNSEAFHNPEERLKAWEAMDRALIKAVGRN